MILVHNHTKNDELSSSFESSFFSFLSFDQVSNFQQQIHLEYLPLHHLQLEIGSFHSIIVGTSRSVESIIGHCQNRLNPRKHIRSVFCCIFLLHKLILRAIKSCSNNSIRNIIIHFLFLNTTKYYICFFTCSFKNYIVAFIHFLNC